MCSAQKLEGLRLTKCSSHGAARLIRLRSMGLWVTDTFARCLLGRLVAAAAVLAVVATATAALAARTSGNDGILEGMGDNNSYWAFLMVPLVIAQDL